MAKKKRVTIPKLEKKVWGYVSLAVRLLATDDKGYCACSTCNKSLYYYGGAVHAGHFRSRKEKFVKYLFRNLNPQCATCNTYKEGEQFLHGVYIDKKYGEGFADVLTHFGRKTFKNEGIDFREYLNNKLEECLIIFSMYLHLPEWQDKIDKLHLKRVKELANNQTEWDECTDPVLSMIMDEL